jgi:hypothetical protein
MFCGEIVIAKTCNAAHLRTHKLEVSLIGDNPGRLAAGFFLNCTKNIELTRSRFVRRV